MPDLIQSHRSTKLNAPRHERPEVKYRQQTRALHTGSVAWQRLRDMVLARQPLCPECFKEGRTVPATEVDHIDGNASTMESNDLNNLQGLCKPHHSRKTMNEVNSRRKDS